MWVFNSFLLETLSFSEANTPVPPPPFFFGVLVIFQQWSWGENGTLFCSMMTIQMTYWMHLVLTPITTIPRKKNKHHGSTVTGRSCVCTHSLTRPSFYMTSLWRRGCIFFWPQGSTPPESSDQSWWHSGKFEFTTSFGETSDWREGSFGWAKAKREKHCWKR